MLVASSSEHLKRRDRWFAAALVIFRFLVPLLLLHPVWEFHRDELLYFAMGDHFTPFRMQFPPFIAGVARVGRALFGDAVWAARVPAAAGGAALLLVLLWLVRQLGGRRWAMAMVALGMFASPVYLRASVLLHPVVFDQLWATLAFAAIILAADREEPRWWLLVGFALGAGALTKFSAAFYAFSIVVTVVLVPPLRRQLATPWPWLGVIAAAILAVPSLTGQLAHGWPFLRQLTALRVTQLEATSPIGFLVEQPMMLGGALVLVIGGVIAAVRGTVPARVALCCSGVLLLLMLALRGKGYYAAPGYPVLIAVGATWMERALAFPAARSTPRRVGSWLVPAVMGAMGLLLLPLGIPFLAPDAMARYSAALGVTAATRTNRGSTLPLPQDYADMLGWRAMAEAVGDVVTALAPHERGDVLVVGGNYGEAGGLAMYRNRFGLPYPASVHGDFHAWGTGGRGGGVTVIVDRPNARAGLEQRFDVVREVYQHLESRAVEEERDVRIYVARRPRQPIDAWWRAHGPRWNRKCAQGRKPSAMVLGVRPPDMLASLVRRPDQRLPGSLAATQRSRTVGRTRLAAVERTRGLREGRFRLVRSQQKPALASKP